MSRRYSPRLAAPDCHRSSCVTVVTGEALVNWLLRINEPVTMTSSTSRSESASEDCCAYTVGVHNSGVRNRADAPARTAGTFFPLDFIFLLYCAFYGSCFSRVKCQRSQQKT